MEGCLARLNRPPVVWDWDAVYILKWMDVEWIKGGEIRVLDAAFTGCWAFFFFFFLFKIARLKDIYVDKTYAVSSWRAMTLDNSFKWKGFDFSESEKQILFN